MNYNNFKTSIYCVANSLEKIKDPAQLEKDFSFIEKYMHIDKVYIETFRVSHFLSEEKLLMIKKFFKNKGIKTSGGITLNRDSGSLWKFESLCYSDPENIKLLKKIAAYTAKYFDQVILDDFFFTNCKCDNCIREKGEKNWNEYRTESLKEISKKIIKYAKDENPSVEVIIKYPNWYDDYQYTGYNLKEQPGIFDSVYTGTETRDPAYSQQNLPRYLGYFLMRYIENVKPGKNNGGWFDPFDCSYNLNSYLEQSYLTMFAKAREITLFCLHALVKDFDQFTPLAGYSFQRVDKFIGKLGNPQGIACYRPENSSGENYLLPTLGMIGLPLEPYPYFPENDEVILLSQSASFDNNLIDKVKNHLKKGKTIIMTSGLAEKIKNKGLKEIIDVDFTNKKVSVNRMAVDYNFCAYNEYFEINGEIAIPHIEYATNDNWPVIVGQNSDNSYPVLLKTDYSNGELIILTVPERLSDLYNFPVGVLESLRKEASKALPVYMNGQSKTSLFLYDNDTFIVESFLLHNSSPTIIIKQKDVEIIDLESEEVIPGVSIENETHIKVSLRASTFRAFKIRNKI